MDGDTIHVLRGGERAKLRLLSVDTEEKLTGRSFTPEKPETVYGEETALWAQEFFAELAGEDEPPRVGLLFPDGEEAFDIYGRLLCHVLLPDGTDFNLHLVRTGRSPYFNKYGHSRVCHGAFVEAQERARAERLGIWNPATNAAATPDAPEVRRPYARLMPWWQCRADAIDAFRERSAAEPEAYAAADWPADLERAVESGRPVDVFGALHALFDEEDGSLTLLFRYGDRERALRARVAPEHRAAFTHLELPHRMDAYRQNYLYARGIIRPGPEPYGGYEMWLEEAGDLRLAGAEPRVPTGSPPGLAGR